MIRSLGLEEYPGSWAMLLTAEDNYTRTGTALAGELSGSAFYLS